ncbi:MAG: class I SAM-dependent methyltransferase [Candidatus Cloacimonetes bacterium]|nr:class I SAM-dependent methyltransferase [Candidatus Cloacimonadota bacterium]
MKYDTVKDKFAKYIDLFPTLRVCFYTFLDLILLRQMYVKQKIGTYFTPGKPMAFYDAGAGFCQYSYHILKKYPHSRVLTVDLKEDYMDSFKSYAEDNLEGIITVKQADLQNFVPKEQYHLAIAIDILEHIEDDVSVMKNIHSSLKKDGIFIVSTPSNFDEAAKFTEEHVRPGYDKKELEDKLTDSGFKIIESAYSYGRYGKIAWKLGMKIPMQLAGKGVFGMIAAGMWMTMLYPVNYLLMKKDLITENSIGNGIIIVAEKV